MFIYKTIIPCVAYNIDESVYTEDDDLIRDDKFHNIFKNMNKREYLVLKSYTDYTISNYDLLELKYNSEINVSKKTEFEIETMLQSIFWSENNKIHESKFHLIKSTFYIDDDNHGYLDCIWYVSEKIPNNIINNNCINDWSECLHVIPFYSNKNYKIMRKYCNLSPDILSIISTYNATPYNLDISAKINMKVEKLSS